MSVKNFSGGSRMDFSFSPEEENFRKEVQDFFIGEAKLVAEAKEEAESGEGFGPSSWKIMGMIGEKGWLCPTWPREFGGLELPYIYRYIIMEQMHHFLNLFGTVGAGMAGPILLRHGSEEQKLKYLLPIARGKIEFALGYTEPQAGSDVAALSIKAEDKGDHYLINGSKLFNTRVHWAQYHWLGARTATTQPKHKGISLFAIDLKTPGISISPIWTVGGVRTNEVYYDNVKVPKEALVGEENKGFYYIVEALDYERISTVGGLERDFEELVDYIKHTRKGNDPLIHQKLAGLATEIESARILALRVAWMLNIKQVPNYEAAMLKMLVAEIEQRLVNTALQVLGPYGQIRKGSRWAQLNGKFEKLYRNSLEDLITRGTSEIMRTIIAQRGLGLPRG
jgi:hypothetical protein